MGQKIEFTPQELYDQFHAEENPFASDPVKRKRVDDVLARLFEPVMSNEVFGCGVHVDRAADFVLLGGDEEKFLALNKLWAWDTPRLLRQEQDLAGLRQLKEKHPELFT